MEQFKHGYALLIGIANYPYINRLPETVLKDTQDIFTILHSEKTCGYPKDHVRLLLDSQASIKGIRNGFKWLSESCTKDDTAIIFISSHGGRIESGPQAGNYLLPFDCMPAHIKETAISASELTHLMRGVQANRFLALFDFCFSGGTGETKNSLETVTGFKVGLKGEEYELLAQGRGRVIMASSRPDEESFVLPEMKNSLFTHYLLEALRGKAFSRGDGLIRVFDIFHYIVDSIRVNGQQHPIFKSSDLEDNFPVALWLGGKGEISNYYPSQSAVGHIDKRALRESLVSYFSRDELKVLCSDLEQNLSDEGINLLVNLEMVGGDGSLPIQTLNLINYLDRRGYLNYLVYALRQGRPGIMCSA